MSFYQSAERPYRWEGLCWGGGGWAAQIWVRSGSPGFPGRGAWGLLQSWGEACRGEAAPLEPLQKMLAVQLLSGDATSCLHSFSFWDLFNISNKNKINNCSVYGNLRQKWRRLRRKRSGSRPGGGLEDPHFLGVSSFVLQFVSPFYQTHAFSPLATPPLIRIDSHADSWAWHACPCVRACTHKLC